MTGDEDGIRSRDRHLVIRDSIIGEGCVIGVSNVTRSVLAPGTIVRDGEIVTDRKG